MNSIDEFGECDVAVITMPPPVAVTEAHFATVVFRPETRRFRPGTGPARLRYYTLELCCDHATDSKPTQLCEWAGPSHFNHGVSPQPDVQSLLAAIERVI